MALHGMNVGVWLSAGALALAGCSSDSANGNAPPNGVDGSPGGAGGNPSSGGGSAVGGKGNGGTSSGGTGAAGTSGGAGVGGASAGGASEAGVDGGDSGDAGTSDASLGDASPRDAGGATGSGGASSGGASSGGASSGGASSGGASSGGAGSGGGPADGGPHMRVFVTKDTFSGDLKAAAGGSVANGLAGGDKLCNDRAAAAALGGTWVAWLSDSTTNAIDRVTDVGPWYRIDGVEAFQDKAALSGNPQVALDVNETGTITAFLPWTGTLANGTKDTHTCADWTNGSTGSGMCGSSSSTASNGWTQTGSLPCNIPYNLYCFEQ